RSHRVRGLGPRRRRARRNGSVASRSILRSRCVREARSGESGSVSATALRACARRRIQSYRYLQTSKRRLSARWVRPSLGARTDLRASRRTLRPARRRPARTGGARRCGDRMKTLAERLSLFGAGLVDRALLRAMSRGRAPKLADLERVREEIAA